MRFSWPDHGSRLGFIRFVEPKGIGIGINRTEGMRETENNEFDKKGKKKTPKMEKEKKRKRSIEFKEVDEDEQTAGRGKKMTQKG